MEKKLKIAAVDDDPFICDILTGCLKSQYDITTFQSGKELLPYIAENDVDLILLDYEMPEMTGFEVLMGIQAQHYKAPVIFLTGVINDRMEIEMRERGAKDYIRKPIDATKLKTCIQKYIR
jgi:DNA-binding response OmpR family regulator